MAFYSHRFKNNDHIHAITIPSKGNNQTMCNQSKTFSYSWVLKIKDKEDKEDLKLFQKKSNGLCFM